MTHHPKRIRTISNTLGCKIKSTGMLKGYSIHLETVVLVDHALYSSFTGRLLLFHDQYQTLSPIGWPKDGSTTVGGPYYLPHRQEKSYSIDEVEEML